MAEIHYRPLFGRQASVVCWGNPPMDVEYPAILEKLKHEPTLRCGYSGCGVVCYVLFKATEVGNNVEDFLCADCWNRWNRLLNP